MQQCSVVSEAFIDRPDHTEASVNQWASMPKVNDRKSCGKLRWLTEAIVNKSSFHLDVAAASAAAAAAAAYTTALRAP